MQLIIICLFFLGCMQCLGQESDSLQVTYRLSIYSEVATARRAVLHIRDNVTIFETMHSEMIAIDRNDDRAEVFLTLTRDKNIDDGYIRIDHVSRELLGFENTNRHKMLVTDAFSEMVWEISGERKDIAGYACIKATTVYRGRDWIAWFAPDIALPYGPWKLNGLPGLILAAQSADGRYIMDFLKLESVKSPIFDKDFKSLLETRNTAPLGYQAFLDVQRESFENMLKETQAKFGGQSSPIQWAPRTGYELKYEWEE